jgi:hypothetical protein
MVDGGQTLGHRTKVANFMKFELSVPVPVRVYVSCTLDDTLSSFALPCNANPESNHYLTSLFVCLFVCLCVCLSLLFLVRHNVAFNGEATTS